MGNNNDISDVMPDINIEEIAPSQPEEKDDSKQFDITGKARQESIKAARTLLAQAAGGKKLTRKNQLALYQHLLDHCVASDKMISALVHDMHRIVQAVAQGEVNTFALRTNVKTIAAVLQKKGLVDVDELRRVHDEEVLPGELPPGMDAEVADRLKNNALHQADEDLKD